MKEFDIEKLAAIFAGVTVVKEGFLPSKTAVVSADLYDKLIADDAVKASLGHDDKYLMGALCRIDPKGDIEISSEVRPFIGKFCRIVRRLKSGLIEICIDDNINFKVAVPQSDIELL